MPKIETTVSEIPLNRPTANGVPLTIESYPTSYNDLPYLTLIQFQTDSNLVVVDNCVDGSVKAYVLDLCDSENIDTHEFLHIVEHWYGTNRFNYPISIEFGKLGITNTTSKILRLFQSDYIQRIIGPVPKYDMGSSTTSVRRRRCNKITREEAQRLMET